MVVAAQTAPPAGTSGMGGMGSMGMGKRSAGGKSATCDYAKAFGDAIAAEFEAALGLPGSESLDNVLDSVVVLGSGGCTRTTTQTATVELTYKPESSPVDSVVYAATARAWQAGRDFPMTIMVCGCSAFVNLIDTSSGYTGITGKGTPKTGKCKGGYSPGSAAKSAKKATLLSGSVGTQSTMAAVATVATVAVLVAVVAMALVKRRIMGRPRLPLPDAEDGVVPQNLMFDRDVLVVTQNPLFKGDEVDAI
jgi:hypothetical protein